MKKYKKSGLWAAALLVLLFVLLTIVQMNSPAGHDEVSSVLHGVFILFSASIAGFFAVVWLLIAFWGRKKWRIIFLLILFSPFVYFLLKLAVLRFDRYQWAQQSKERDYQITLIAEEHIRRMKALKGNKNELIGIRQSFDDEMVRIGENTLQRAPKRKFYWVHNLYVWLFVDRYYKPEEISGVIDFPDDAGCEQFLQEFDDLFTQEWQYQDFAAACPNTPR